MPDESVRHQLRDLGKLQFLSIRSLHCCRFKSRRYVPSFVVLNVTCNNNLNLLVSNCGKKSSELTQTQVFCSPALQPKNEVDEEIKVEGLASSGKFYRPVLRTSFVYKNLFTDEESESDVEFEKV